MDCVDGVVAAVPTRSKKAFVKHARVAAQEFKEAGAMRVVECWGDGGLDARDLCQLRVHAVQDRSA